MEEKISKEAMEVVKIINEISKEMMLLDYEQMNGTCKEKITNLVKNSERTIETGIIPGKVE
jgi:hypothetical protein